MAIVRSAGTEIIRTAHFEDINNTTQPLIIGVQHHIYTVLSFTVFYVTVSATSDDWQVFLTGFDSFAGDSGETILLTKNSGSANDTFVWNDKFSFTGCEPTGFSGALSTVAEQDALADQGTATAQKLQMYCTSGMTVDCHLTFIDQNNA